MNDDDFYNDLSKFLSFQIIQQLEKNLYHDQAENRLTMKTPVEL